MSKNPVKCSFTQVYDLCRQIENILVCTDFELYDCYPIKNFLQEQGSHVSDKFDQESLLHKFIIYWIERFQESYMRGAYEFFIVDLGRTTEADLFLIPQLFERNGINHPSFDEYLQTHGLGIESHLSEDIVIGYHFFLMKQPEYPDLIENIKQEIFYVLFPNRNFLKLFNEEIAKNARLLGREKQKRKPIPKWVQKAVFHRDKGRCCFCFKDLTSFPNINITNYDHIIPLSNFGFNDVTNIQLLCDECNRKKSDKSDAVGDHYYLWY